MRYALHLAEYAQSQGEIPIGAVLVHKNQIIGIGWNKMISHHDPTAHAEIVALRHGGFIMRNYRLLECTLYVTIEPCMMCSGALLHSRIDTLIYGAKNKKNGSPDPVFNICKTQSTNHQIKVIGGILAKASADILRNFFRVRRLEKKQQQMKKK